MASNEPSANIREIKCPQCEKGQMHIQNVMGSTREIFWKCNSCDYKCKTEYDKIRRGQLTFFEVLA